MNALVVVIARMLAIAASEGMQAVVVAGIEPVVVGSERFEEVRALRKG